MPDVRVRTQEVVRALIVTLPDQPMDQVVGMIADRVCEVWEGLLSAIIRNADFVDCDHGLFLIDSGWMTNIEPDDIAMMMKMREDK